MNKPLITAGHILVWFGILALLIFNMLYSFALLAIIYVGIILGFCRNNIAIAFAKDHEHNLHPEYPNNAPDDMEGST